MNGREYAWNRCPYTHTHVFIITIRPIFLFWGVTHVPPAGGRSAARRVQKTPQNRHQQCCQAICVHPFIAYCAGGQTSSAVGRLNVLGKVGRAQMEFRAGHTTHCDIHQNMKFFFLQIGMFITLSRFISPLSCPKHTLFCDTQRVENIPKFTARCTVR